MKPFQMQSLLAEKGITLSPKMLEQFDQYYQLLKQWNDVMNLTSIIEEEAVYEKHFYDSLALAMAMPLHDQMICDVGAGAGFPSIPLKIAFPYLHIEIVDPLQKRMRFLTTVISEMVFKDVQLVVRRAEDYAEAREKFDIVTARAVAPLPILLELCAHLVKKNGFLVAYKGAQSEEELKLSVHAMKELHLVLDNTFSFVLPYEQSTRQLLIFRKTKVTDSRYPRPFAQIKSRPL